jgi:D-arabinose 1-dehydrogenase-like Zn-dependent alcohol dehydrogenase
MAKMRAAQVARPGGDFELVEREIPAPGAGMVRLRVEACGICHSDSLAREGTFPGVQFPRVPGHEVAGVVDAVGAGVAGWAVGQRAGAGWHGGSCGHCDTCRRGDAFACPATATTGITFDGGYATHMIAPAGALARIPEALPAVDAAPLMCAGITTYNALRNSGARPGETVAILGLGGLGHLGVQFASKMGFRTVAIARGADKRPLALKLGASHYIDSRAGDPAAALSAIGGASVILATVIQGEAMSAVVGGLATNGTLMVVGAAGPMQVEPLALIMGRRSVKGWYSGTSIDTQDTLDFAALSGVRSMNEVYPLDSAADAYDRMMSGEARFRVVLKMPE